MIKVIPQFQWFGEDMSFIELSRRQVLFNIATEEEQRAGKVAEVFISSAKMQQSNATMWQFILFGIGFIVVNIYRDGASQRT